MAEDAENPSPAAEQADVNALEGTDTAAEAEAGSLEGGTSTDESGTIDATSHGGSTQAVPPPPKKSGFKAFLQRFNLYLLLFIFILLVGGCILTIAYFQSKKATTTDSLKTQELTQDALRQIANSDATVGSSGQILNVQSSAVFAGKVLIRDGLEVASNLQVGGTTALTSLTVSGTSQFGQMQINKDLAVAGDAAVQGSLTAKSLQVSGGGTFSGPVSAPQLTTTNLQLNGDLVLTHHLVAGGPTPSLSRGAALGSGGSASISGSDTSGTVNINVGGGPPAGCFATISFRSRYDSTPHVTITPVGADGGTLDYYVNRSTSSFSICDATAPPAGSSFAFDYFVVD
jgi:hypothetical protein